MTCFIILTTFFVYLTSTECNVVEHRTPIGVFRGFESEIRHTRVRIFYGIRYGEQSKRERFREALLYVTNKNNFTDATNRPVSCPQGNHKRLGDSPAVKQWFVNTRIDEDCLFLNIWQPVKQQGNEAKKPVIVFIHGGGFTVGSSTLDIYDGKYLAAHSDVVVVSFQYRLGALGFLYTGDDFAPGNAGLKDQVLALKWVNEYIEHFGGDKDKITLIGFSAGSASVGYHLLSSETSKLFKRAVLLSGTPNAEWAYISPSEARQRAISFAARLGADPSNYTDVKKYLTRREWEHYINMQEDFGDTNLPFVPPFVPTMEPSLVPEHPIRMLRKASHLKGKEVIVSCTKDDGSMLLIFTLMGIEKIRDPLDEFSLSKQEFKEILKTLSKANDNETSELFKLYDNSQPNPYIKGLIRAYSDRLLSCPSNQFINELRIHDATVHHLEYNYSPMHPLWPTWAGVMHGYDIPMLFGEPIYKTDIYPPQDTGVSEMYIDRIKNFVHFGNPNVPGQLSWFKDQMFVMTTAPLRETVFDNRSAACLKLKQIMPAYLSGSNQLQYGILTLFLIFIALKTFL